MYRLESVLFLCTVHISDAQLCVISLSNRIPRSVARGFVLFVLLICDFNVVKTVLVPVETVTGNLFPNECDKKYSHYIRLPVPCDLAKHLVNLATPVSRYCNN